MQKKSDFLIGAITERFGVVKRARGCFLYTAKNVRLTDLWQQNGRAILGWGNGGAISVFKNVLERKICGTFDTDFSPKINDLTSRLSRAVNELFGEERRIVVFERAFDYDSIYEFLKTRFKIDAKIFRPWNTESLALAQFPAIYFEVPFAFGDGIFILALKKDFRTDIKNSYRIPAPLCAAITRAIYDLIQELPKRSEKNWFVYDTILTKYWNRRGPYLFPKVPCEKWQDFLIHCLDCHLVISPDFETPSIVPFGADAGNFSLLKKSPFDF